MGFKEGIFSDRSYQTGGKESQEGEGRIGTTEMNNAG